LRKTRTSVNGPVPTGSGLAKVTGSSTASQMCRGTMGWMAMSAMPGMNTRLKSNSTVRASGARTAARKPHTLRRSSAPCRRNSSKVKRTSSAEKGVPSDHETPSRKLKRSVRLSADQVSSVASQGTQASVMALKIINGS
jgi:hypothetical protein